MNRISKFTSALAVMSVLVLSACTGDNYKQPDSSIFGCVRDIDTGELIPQDINISTGSRLHIIELGYADESIRQLNFKSDGTYCDKNLFAGRYSLSTPKSVNFVPIDTMYIDIKGPTEVNIETRPYLRVFLNEITYERKTGLLKATFKLEAGDPLYSSVDSYAIFFWPHKDVSEGMTKLKSPVKDGGYVDPTKTYVTTLNVSAVAKNQPGDYWCVLGAKGPKDATYNYSERVLVNINNKAW
ncbi:MAG: DUF3823 domain-containing protein [Bacteroidales bacterium]|nr:DUF3823 domain-containing protein [Bacteroidales bacterium]